jgi:hypothetical protein
MAFKSFKCRDKVELFGYLSHCEVVLLLLRRLVKGLLNNNISMRRLQNFLRRDVLLRVVVLLLLWIL